MRMRSFRINLAAAGLSLITSAALGFSAQASYITTLNNIAGADRISHWNLNETIGTTAADSWGVGTLDGANDGTYSGIGNGVNLGAAGPSSADGFAGFGPSNNAVEFTGTSSQLLQMANAASFDGVQELTMMLWFNIPSSIADVDSIQRFYGGIHSNGSDGETAGRYGFAINAGRTDAGGQGISQKGRPRAFVRLNDTNDPDLELVLDSTLSGVAAPSPPTNYRDGNWHFLVMTMYDDGTDKTMDVYVDNNLRFTETLAGAAGEDLSVRHTSGTAGVLAFGLDLGDTNRRFLGRMDEITFIGRGLTAGEVGALYTAAQVPEPSTVALLGLAVAGVAFRRRLFRSL